jgi:DNA-binding CsgD family transcriptional regulator
MKASDFNPDRFVPFLNALPTTSDLEPWLIRFRESLRQLLGDVDRVGVNVNVGCDLHRSRERETFTLYFLQAFAPERGQNPEVAVGICPQDRHHYERLLEVSYRFLSREEHHPVHGVDYHYNGSYIGSILLWRARQQPPISEETLKLLEDLRPFIIFAFSDAIARFRYVRPGGRTLQRIASIIRRDIGLTDREWEVLQLQMSGMSYKEIADCLNLSVVAVKKRVAQIYRKAGVENQFELFARYCTERLYEPIAEYRVLRL